MSKFNVLFGLILIALLGSPMHAQEVKTKKSLFQKAGSKWRKTIYPTLEFTINHPAQRKLPLKRVAFKAEGKRSNHKEAARELIATAEPYFSAYGGVSLLDRENMDSLEDEVDFSNSGMVSDDQVIDYGANMSATTMFIVRVTKLETTTRRTSNGDPSQTIHLVASVKAIDTKTKKVLGSQSIRESASDAELDLKGLTNFKAKRSLRDKVMQRAAEQIRNYFVPWKDQKTLVFFKGKNLGMNRAYQALNGQDFAGARMFAEDSFQQAMNDKGAKSKHRARAIYNRAVIHFADGEFDDAINVVREANRIDYEPPFAELQSLVKDALDARNKLISDGDADEKDKRRAAKNATRPQRNQNDPLAAKLERLKNLRDEGILTEAEYKKKRQEVLAEL